MRLSELLVLSMVLMIGSNSSISAEEIQLSPNEEKIQTKKKEKIDKWASKKKEEEGYYSFMNKNSDSNQPVQTNQPGPAAQSDNKIENPKEESGYYSFVKEKYKSEPDQNSTSSVSNVAPEAPPVKALTPPAPITEIPVRKVFAWKATKNNKTIYLTGTISTLDSSFKQFPNEIEAVFLNAPVLITESTEVKPAIRDGIVKKLAEMPKDKTISSYLSPETKKELDEYLSWSGENLAMYNNCKPVIASYLITKAIMRADGIRPQNMDDFYERRAKKLGKKIIPLKSYEYELKELQKLDDSEQNRILRCSLITLKNNRHSFKPYFQQNELAWRNGDANKIYALDSSVCVGNADLNKWYLDNMKEQNVLMANRIDELLNSNDRALVAVSAVNFGGDQGILEQLKTKGFVIEQLLVSPSKMSSGTTKISGQFFPDGKFYAAFPGKPFFHKSDDRSTLIGMNSYLYQNKTGDALGVLWAEPKLNSHSVAQLLDSVSMPQFKNAEIRLIECGGLEGREYKFADGKGLAREFTNGKIVYVIAISGSAAWLKSPAVEKFFDSFAIAPEPRQVTRNSAGQSTSRYYSNMPVVSTRDKYRNNNDQANDYWHRQGAGPGYKQNYRNNNDQANDYWARNSRRR